VGLGAGLAKGGLEAIKASSVQKAALFIVLESGNETVFKAPASW
jgi:hypothetical protein